MKTSDVRIISEFDKGTLLQLQELIDDGGDTYARIVARIPIAELQRPRTGQSTLTTDLKAIFTRKGIGPTAKEALGNARGGQGIFRTTVLQLWNGRCLVTGSTTLDAIRASHVKPWLTRLIQSDWNPSTESRLWRALMRCSTPV